MKQEFDRHQWMTLDEHKLQASRTMQQQMKQKQKKHRNNQPMTYTDWLYKTILYALVAYGWMHIIFWVMMK